MSKEGSRKARTPRKRFAVGCGNLLDNAIEANLKIPETETRFIEMTAHRKRGNFIMKISNPFVRGNDAVDCSYGISDVRTEGKTSSSKALFYTSKENTKNHGYGLRNLREVVEKKGGFYTAEVRDGVYSAYIILPCSSSIA